MLLLIDRFYLLDAGRDRKTTSKNTFFAFFSAKTSCLNATNPERSVNLKNDLNNGIRDPWGSR